MNKHREIIYSRRRKVLSSQNIKNDIILLIEQEVEKLVLAHTSTSNRDQDWNYEEILNDLKAIHRETISELDIKEIQNIHLQEELIEKLKTDSRSFGSNICRMNEGRNNYRLKHGKWRIIFTIENGVIDIKRIASRSKHTYSHL
jgi:preprotein translocase subunit SecA